MLAMAPLLLRRPTSNTGSIIMKSRLLSCALALALALSGAALVPDCQAAPKKIKVWTGNPKGDPVLAGMEEAFKPYVEKESKGKYVVEIYPSMSLGSSDSAFQGAQFGSIQIVVDSVNNVGQFIPQLAAFDVPYLLPDQEKLDRAFKSKAVEKLWNYAYKKGIKPLNVVLATYRGILSTKPILKLEDAKGVKDRTSNSKYHIASMEALGFIPTPMAASEVLTALQQGVIESVDYEWHAFVAQRVVDVAKNLILSDHLPVLYMAYTSNDWWEGLPKADREMFAKALELYRQHVMGIYKEKNAKVLDVMAKDFGVKVTRPSAEEKARWIEASKGALSKFPAEIAALAEEIRAAGEGK